MKKVKNDDLEWMLPGFHPHFITSARGKKIGAFFEIEEYQKLVETIEDVYFGALATAIKSKDAGKPSISLEALKKELVKKKKRKKS